MADVTPQADSRSDPRVVRSRAAVLEAATALFLRDGYNATTMDGVAEAAGVSKRTIYNNFRDKEALFREVTMAATNIADAFAAEVARDLDEPQDVEAALTALARRLVESATAPEVIRLRRLLIAEALRFPDLAAEYQRRAPGRVISALAVAFERLAGEGRLRVADPHRAAEQYAFLVVGAALDRAMFDGTASPQDIEALHAAADAGVRSFLAVYGAAARSG